MKKLILIFTIILLSLFTDASADEPLIEFESYTTAVRGNKFYLECDAKKNTTTCFEVTEKGGREKWTIQTVAYSVSVSENGVFCILDNTMRLVETDYNEDTVLFTVYNEFNAKTKNVRTGDFYWY